MERQAHHHIHPIDKQKKGVSKLIYLNFLKSFNFSSFTFLQKPYIIFFWMKVQTVINGFGCIFRLLFRVIKSKDY